MDSFYCLVRIILNKRLSLYCFSCFSSYSIDSQLLNFSYPICFTAKSCQDIIDLLSLHTYFETISISHISYLAVELYKAELSLILEQYYIQD